MSKVAYYGEEAKLPENFADQVLELEIKIENQDCDLSTIQHLNELYRVPRELNQIAIEYYISVDVKKSTHFQKKLTQLLTSPTTLRLIDYKPAKTLAKVSSQTKLHHDTVSNHEQLQRFKSQPKHFVKTIMQNNEKKLQHQENIIRDNIMKQQDSIKNRVLQRVRSRNKL